MNKLIAAAMMLTACSSKPAPVAVAIEPTYVFEMTEAGDDLPVFIGVGTSLPLAESHASVVGWRSRCHGGFITVSNGVKLSCRM